MAAHNGHANVHWILYWPLRVPLQVRRSNHVKTNLTWPYQSKGTIKKTLFEREGLIEKSYPKLISRGNLIGIIKLKGFFYIFIAVGVYKNQFKMYSHKYKSCIILFFVRYNQTQRLFYCYWSL